MDDQITTEEAEESTKTPEKGGSAHLRRRINRAMRRARKTAGTDFDENRGEVQFALEEARILAMLDVADALRGGQSAVES